MNIDEATLTQIKKTLIYMNTDDILTLSHPQVIELFCRKLPVQKSREWFKARTSCITASDIGSALPCSKAVCKFYVDEFKLHDSFKFSDTRCCNKYGSLKELIIKKVQQDAIHDIRADLPPFRGGVAVAHGQMFEPVAQIIYCQIQQEDLAEFGLVQHPTIPFLAASPDGISIISGRMLEIKCPLTRPIDTVPPLAYWQQMQAQMECCQLDMCDFMDCQFVRYLFKDEWLEDARTWESQYGASSNHHLYGIILKDAEEDDYYYAGGQIVSLDEFEHWAKEKAEELERDAGIQAEPIYYRLKNHYITHVRKDPQWLAVNLPILKEVWDQVTKFRTLEGAVEYASYLLDKKARVSSTASPPPMPRRKVVAPIDPFWSETCLC
jgi:putative phage-type endonuclease